MKWNPFDDNIIASASEDCRVRLWYISQGGLTSDLHKPLVTLTGHRSALVIELTPLFKVVTFQEKSWFDRVAPNC